MKRLPLVVIHRLFGAAALLVLAGLFGFLGYLYADFSGPLIGDIEPSASADVLTKLDAKRLETTVKRFETRQGLPDIPSDLPDPYNSARQQAQPVPTEAAPPPGAP